MKIGVFFTVQWISSFENFKIGFTATKTPENLWPEIRETAKIYAIFRPSSMMCKNLDHVSHNGVKLFIFAFCHMKNFGLVFKCKA
jgi:hypothetical protein